MGGAASGLAGFGAIAEQHGFGLRRIDHGRDDHLASRAQFGQRFAGEATFGCKRLGHPSAHVEGKNFVASQAQALRHAQAHRAQTNHTYSFCHTAT